MFLVYRSQHTSTRYLTRTFAIYTMRVLCQIFVDILVTQFFFSGVASMLSEKSADRRNNMHIYLRDWQDFQYTNAVFR